MLFSGRHTLVGCGILRRELDWLAKKNAWPLDMRFLDPLLHCSFAKLAPALRSLLAKYPDHSDVAVFYGTCHPCVDEIIGREGVARTQGQNCIEMLLGQEAMEAQLGDGAFFLLQDWVYSWDRFVMTAFGTQDMEIVREIFRCDRRFLLALRTPCSDDYTAQAEYAAQVAGLPLRWMDVALDHLEEIMHTALFSKEAMV